MFLKHVLLSRQRTIMEPSRACNLCVSTSPAGPCNCTQVPAISVRLPSTRPSLAAMGGAHPMSGAESPLPAGRLLGPAPDAQMQTRPMFTAAVRMCASGDTPIASSPTDSLRLSEVQSWLQTCHHAVSDSLSESSKCACMTMSRSRRAWSK